ncbi:MAG: M24 family metallopeptidase [Chloroflexota bacterium]|nr:M24 family metallopeptidase [Chloroflexota bacterium]
MVDDELSAKLGTVRRLFGDGQLSAIRLRGVDWFAWATCGGSSVVDASSESGVAEVLITESDALVLADRIDGPRIADEQSFAGLRVVETSWAEPRAREEVVHELVGEGARVASDRPRNDEAPLPDELVAARRRLLPGEIERFRVIGRDAAAAVTEVLSAAAPTMSENELAGRAAAALLRRGLFPVVLLVGGARRLPLYRHPLPTDEQIGERVMLVACARRYGLVANLTRFVYFRPPNGDEGARHAAVAEVEAAAFAASTPPATLGEVYGTIVDAYARAGYAGAERDHHQGGLAGYRAREEVALPDSTTIIAKGAALAWNPSLPGAKIEDTVVAGDGGVEVLTVDPAWPTVEVAGRRRPDVLLAAG